MGVRSRTIAIRMNDGSWISKDFESLPSDTTALSGMAVELIVEAGRKTTDVVEIIVD